jgi:hypothetical protein
MQKQKRLAWKILRGEERRLQRLLDNFGPGLAAKKIPENKAFPGLL